MTDFGAGTESQNLFENHRLGIRFEPRFPQECSTWNNSSWCGAGTPARDFLNSSRPSTAPNKRASRTLVPPVAGTKYGEPIVPRGTFLSLLGPFLVWRGHSCPRKSEVLGSRQQSRTAWGTSAPGRADQVGSRLFHVEHFPGLLDSRGVFHVEHSAQCQRRPHPEGNPNDQSISSE